MTSRTANPGGVRATQNDGQAFRTTAGAIVGRGSQKVLLGAIGSLVVAGLAEAAVRTGMLSSDDVPLLSEVTVKLGHLAAEGTFWSAMADTVQQAFLGLALAALIAVPAGALIGSFEVVWRALRPTIELLRPVPGVALIPIVTLVWGATNLSVVILCTFACVWPLLIQSIYGVREVDGVAVDAARAYGLSRAQRATKVILPSALPFVATGVRVAMSASLIIAITVEFLAGAPGLGQQIVFALSGSDNVLLYALILGVCLLGLILDLASAAIERRLLHWTFAFQGDR